MPAPPVYARCGAGVMGAWGRGRECPRSNRPSADRAFHLELDQPIQLDRVLHGHSRVMGSMKPFTTMAVASASVSPRDIR